MTNGDRKRESARKHNLAIDERSAYIEDEARYPDKYKAPESVRRKMKITQAMASVFAASALEYSISKDANKERCYD